MIFQNPWAWLGLAAVAVPVLVHLLARRPARRLLFPTTRFLPAALMTPVRRGRPSDWLLLIIRSSIMVTAVIALSQPLWMTTTRSQTRAQQLARAIIVDTSRSMQRTTANGETGVTAAKRQATQLADEATRARIGASSSPVSQIAAAVRWLETQPMRRELVIVSDFQTGTISAADLSRVPDDIGRKLVATTVTGPMPAAGAGGGELRLLVGDKERADADAAYTAAELSSKNEAGPAFARKVGPALFLFPTFADRQDWIRTGKPLSQAWMFDVANAIATNSVALAAAERAGVSLSNALQFLSHPIDGADGLVVVVNAPPHTLLAAAVLGATLKAVSDQTPTTESSLTDLSSEELKSLERPPADRSGDRRVPGNESDGRWFWAAAVGLLIVEGIVRRSRKQMEMPHARVA